MLRIVLSLVLLASVAVALPRFPVPHRSDAHAASSLKDKAAPPPYRTEWFTQQLDHFNFWTRPGAPATWQQRVLVADQYWNGTGPIFFYTGNEGDITMFYENTGFMFDIAPRFGALLMFAEHRYYGQSLPFGAQSFTNDNLAYLTMEQALADYAVLLHDWKAAHKCTDVPVIAFGGSYGGMLAAWFRTGYPHVVDGAIAASAPILQFMGVPSFDPEAFSRIVTQDFAMYSDSCAKAIGTAFSVIPQLSQTVGGRDTLSRAFSTCTPLASPADGVLLSTFINNAVTYMAMTNYPYPSSFLRPMPGWPCQATCSRIVADPDIFTLLQSVSNGIGVFYNWTGTEQCYNLTQPVSPGLGDTTWNYQACTEMVLPVSSNGVDDFFPPAPFNVSDVIVQCQQTYSVTPRPYWMPEFTGGDKLKAASNIVFSNGLMDPWMGGGVVHNISDTVVAILIKDGAHHLDLRSADPADPDSVVQARLQEIDHIQRWLAAASIRRTTH